ncbi:MAG: hypothetical protein A3G38_04355 [Omnitrophica WOR_2 bacterium RIFCSPLOWO2_12_FULL_51_8]|nr:MAG: hypothetical protein A3G38_04355 [Omnitrophica WOR_2 bacterium RIFCSPLOWO2_12_FULL_51_8]
MDRKHSLDKLPQDIRSLIYLVRDTAAKKNISAYLVGGFVRDLLLGVENLDLDIVAESDAIGLAGEFARRIGAAEVVRHKRFGTATVRIRPGFKVDTFAAPKPRGKPTPLSINHERSRRIDFSTARKEFYPAPARLPEVSPGNLRDDLFRRDFTINAMAVSIARDSFGRLVDFFGGKADLEQKKIRILHDLSFRDDPTRILRAVRFEQRYNFRIEPGTLRRLKEAVKLKALFDAGPHRLRGELILSLKERSPLKGIKRLSGLAGLQFISPGLKFPAGAQELMRAIAKEIAWFKERYPRRRELDSWLVYCLGLLDPLSLRAVAGVCAKFAFRRGEEKRILDYKKINHKFAADLRKYRQRPSRIFALLEPLAYEVTIAVKAKYRDRPIQEAIADFFEIYNGICIAVGGDDLCRLGLSPGPAYRKIFSKVLSAKLDGRIKSKEEELSLIRQLVKEEQGDV